MMIALHKQARTALIAQHLAKLFDGPALEAEPAVAV